MINGKVLILDESDIIKGSEHKIASELKFDDLRTKSKNLCLNADVVIFNNDKESIVLKNRQGSSGLIAKAITTEIEKPKRKFPWTIIFSSGYLTSRRKKIENNKPKN